MLTILNTANKDEVEDVSWKTLIQDQDTILENLKRLLEQVPRGLQTKFLVCPFCRPLDDMWTHSQDHRSRSGDLIVKHILGVIQQTFSERIENLLSGFKDCRSDDACKRFLAFVVRGIITNAAFASMFADPLHIPTSDELTILTVFVCRLGRMIFGETHQPSTSVRFYCKAHKPQLQQQQGCEIPALYQDGPLHSAVKKVIEIVQESSAASFSSFEDVPDKDQFVQIVCPSDRVVELVGVSLLKQNIPPQSICLLSSSSVSDRNALVSAIEHFVKREAAIASFMRSWLEDYQQLGGCAPAVPEPIRPLYVVCTHGMLTQVASNEQISMFDKKHNNYLSNLIVSAAIPRVPYTPDRQHLLVCLCVSVVFVIVLIVVYLSIKLVGGDMSDHNQNHWV